MGAFEATYYDGKTSEPHAVRVSVQPEGGLWIVGLDVDRLVRRDELRISPRLGDAVRSIFLPHDQKLETTDNEAVDQLARLGGGPRRPLLHRLEKSWPMVCAALVGLLVFVGLGVGVGIPFAARLAADRMPPELAHRLGEDTLLVLDKTVFEPSELGEEERASLEVTFARLGAFHPELDLRLELRALGSPNAFALPNGVIVVTDELVELAEHEDELAAVLAHEIGHVHHRHGLRMVLENSSLALLLGVYVGDLGAMGSILAGLPAVFSQAAYSRSHETEADDHALALMERAGVDPDHFANILRRLGEATGGSAGALDYLSSHPPPEERAARAGRR